ncbi:MAG TPA: ABC transporter permease subunit [Alphaproteobacteria bacterium]|nr:ABC transporter permease subunit [Alphaproteobacteria bacterium]
MSAASRIPIGAGGKAVVVPVALVVLAELAIRLTGFRSDSVAPPSEVVVAAIQALTDGSIARATGETLASAFGGLALGGGVGFALGILLGSSAVLDRLLDFSIETIRPVPPIALMPIALMVFGFGARLEIAVVAFAAIWPILILTRAAIAGIDPQLIEVARALRLGFGARVLKIVVPAILPRVFVALRLAAGISIIVAVTVEITVNPVGLGYAIMIAGQSLRPALMLALLVWIGLVGWAVNFLLLAAERSLFGFAQPRARP